MGSGAPAAHDVSLDNLARFSQITCPIAGVANGDTFNLYVNQQKIASAKDDSFSHGSIGVLAASFNSGNYSCDVVYHNAKVWTF